jgi:predicted nuclease of predicted toxin-antitoxin system
VDTVADENLTGAADADVWAATQRDERFLITQDLDFSDTRVFAPGSHHGILLVRLAAPGRRRLESYLRSLFATEDLRQWAGCLVVATDNKLRVRRAS